MSKILKNLLDFCFSVCFLYLWYRGFILLINFCMDYPHFKFDDPCLMAVILFAAGYQEFTNRK